MSKGRDARWQLLTRLVHVPAAVHVAVAEPVKPAVQVPVADVILGVVSQLAKALVNFEQ